jgi:cytochrome P450 family 135
MPPAVRLPRSLQTLSWVVDAPRFMQRCRARYGPAFCAKFAARAVSGPGAARDEGNWVFLADPEHVKQVFTADPAVVRAGETNRFLEGLVGPRSILILDEPEHMSRRRLMLPPFHGGRIERYGELIRDVAAAEVRRWPRGRRFALWPRMQAITLEVIVRAVFGIREPRRLEHLRGLLRTMLDTMTSRRWLAAQAVRTALVAHPTEGYGARSLRQLLGPVDALLLEEIRARRAAEDTEERDDVLSLLMDARFDDGSAMDDHELRDQLITLLIAGHESTATSLAWAFERLLRHPEKVARLRDEVATGEHRYADAVVTETLRLRPVILLVLRKLAAPLQIGDHVLPPGAWVAPCAYLVHRDEAIYPEPDRFLPERFLDRPPTTYTWLPFGGGVRRCLGASFAQLEMREVLRTVAARVDVRSVSTDGERARRRFITLAPAHGAEVVVDGPRRG